MVEGSQDIKKLIYKNSYLILNKMQAFYKNLLFVEVDDFDAVVDQNLLRLFTLSRGVEPESAKSYFKLVEAMNNSIV